jgi:hypothetical protein
LGWLYPLTELVDSWCRRGTRAASTHVDPIIIYSPIVSRIPCWGGKEQGGIFPNILHFPSQLKKKKEIIFLICLGFCKRNRYF